MGYRIILLFAAISVVILFSGCAIKNNNASQDPVEETLMKAGRGQGELKPTQGGDPELIGANLDEHGCLTAAGYSWCESKGKCLRTWEELCP